MAEPPEEAMTHREARITRVIDAPRDLVWNEWLDPEQVARWWGPHGMTTPLSTIEMDVRPGGLFRLTMVSDADGAEYPTEMAFREVVEPERLVIEWDAQLHFGSGVVTVTFKDLGEKTEVAVHWSGYATDQIFPGIEAGWTEQVARLAEHVGLRRSTTRRNDP
jgi:uncharacterized protein YndB with AHSA1/START domain